MYIELIIYKQRTQKFSLPIILHNKTMSSFKLDFLPKLPFNIKIPNNMSTSQLESAILGGVLFGIAACLYYFVFGKLIGRTSLIKQVSSAKSKNDLAIYATILAGAIFSSAFVKQLHHEHFIDFEPYDSKSFVRNTDEALLAIAGFFVGFGTSLAGGCTVGHGITGIARFKKASLLSVVLFCAAAHLTMRYKLANYIPQQFSNFIKIKLPNNIDTDYYINGCLTLPFLFFLLFKDKSLKGLIKYILNFAIGVLFGAGMMIGGASQRQLVLEAINFTKRYWNPTILVFFSVAAIVCAIIINTLMKNKVTPVFASQVQNPDQSVNFNLIFGSICFGIGWGLAGLCTAAFYLLIPLANIKIPVYWGIPCFLGIKFAALIEGIRNKLRKNK